MKQKQVKAKLKVHLLLGKSISHNQAQKRWHTNRLASYIHRLKKEMREIGFDIVCNIVHGKGREQYGVYFLRKVPFHNRSLRVVTSK